MSEKSPRRPGDLLGPNDPAPAAEVNPSGAAPFLLVGDHAGNAIPEALGSLGLGDADRRRHIALDIGTQALGEALATQLDAAFVHQRYSRLVIDCNRDPARADAIPPISDGTVIPGNAAIDAGERERRTVSVHAPYHAAIAATIARRHAAGRPTILVSLHSFTPRLAGCADRPWQIGVLHDGHADGFARAVLAALALRAELCVGVGDNEPYRMDGTDHTVPRHAFVTALPYVEIEIRQDTLDGPAGVARWAEVLGSSLEAAYRRLGT